MDKNDTDKTEAASVLRPAAGSEFDQAVRRIGWLKDPDTLNKLLDSFQSDGQPMGSDRWAEYCLCRLEELKEIEKTYRRVIQAAQVLGDAQKHCGSSYWRHHIRKMTREFQLEQIEREKFNSQNRAIEENAKDEES